MDIRTKQKLKLLQYIPPYLVSIVLVTAGGVITVNRIIFFKSFFSMNQCIFFFGMALET